MFRTKFFDSGAVVGYAETNDGIRVYTVTDTRNGATVAATTASVVLAVARRWAASQVETPQITSPLAEGERQSSGLAGGGAAANAMSAPVREMLATAARHPQGEIWRGGGRGTFKLPMLRAAARRGWLELNHPIRPAWATITDAGRRALAVELARTGGAR